LEALRRYEIDEILIALPSVSRARKNEIVEFLSQSHLRIMELPGLTELVDGKINIADMKEINIIDLLGRDPVDPVPELFSKKAIQVRREDLVELPEGRYYIFDIIGLEVQDTMGNVLGTVTDVLQPGANDVYVVSKDGEPDQLFAAIEEVVKDIDVENKLMIVDPPEWI